MHDRMCGHLYAYHMVSLTTSWRGGRRKSQLVSGQMGSRVLCGSPTTILWLGMTHTSVCGSHPSPSVLAFSPETVSLPLSLSLSLPFSRIQWNLQLMDSIRLSLLRSRNVCRQGGGGLFVNCREVVHSLECPLLEVPL